MTSKIQQRKAQLSDGLVSFQNSVANRRNAAQNNYFQSTRLSDEACRSIYKTGIGSKIVRVKTGGLLNDTLIFDDERAERFFDNRLRQKVSDALRWMLAFGRGIIVIQEREGADLSKPISADIDRNKVQFKVFSGDIVSALNPDLDLSSPRYNMPKTYAVRGYNFHWTRVIDFTYVKPSEIELPEYRYGGISEFELIHEQLVADGIVQRVVPHIAEKNSTIFYKIKDFKQLLQSGQEEGLVNYFAQLEDHRSVYGAGIVDKDDEVASVSQAMTNLGEVDTITLRRIAMVSSIPMALLVGENVKGLNSTGDHEMAIFCEALEDIERNHVLQPMKTLFSRLGLGDVWLKPNQGETPEKRIEYESKAVDIAFKLYQMGEDYGRYLSDKGIVKERTAEDMLASLFGEIEEDGDMITQSQPTGQKSIVDPSSSLNGAQVTAILDIVSRVRTGEINKDTASRIIMTSFPVSMEQAEELVQDIEVMQNNGVVNGEEG